MSNDNPENGVEVFREYDNAYVHYKDDDDVYEGPVVIYSNGWIDFPAHDGELLNKDEVKAVTPL